MFPGIPIPNITSDFVSNLRFRRRRFFCVLTMQGHSDLLFQARSTIWTNLNCTGPYMLLCKFHQNLPVVSEEMLFLCVDGRTHEHGHTHGRTHAAPCHKLTWPLARWASHVMIASLMSPCFHHSASICNDELLHQCPSPMYYIDLPIKLLCFLLILRKNPCLTINKTKVYKYKQSIYFGYVCNNV